jgi:hypothetical protein
MAGATMGRADRGGAYRPAGVSRVHRGRARFSIRLWSVRHARFLERLYDLFADLMLGLHPLWSWIGYGRVERPILVVERATKSLLFDCRMCGQCILSSTGMSCPMNCPKSMRNGPCGGVRADGNCEVEPDMPCVWVEAWTGAGNMENSDAILDIQPAVDQSLQSSSAWLRATAQAANLKTGERAP